MPRPGTIIRPPLDWWADRAFTAQQWFSSASAAFWAFTLSNNSSDGSRLWVYDAESLSQAAAFPNNTANPGGNPAASSGFVPQPGVTSTPALVTETRSGANGSSPQANTPANLVVGNVLIALIVYNGGSAAQILPPDSSWTRLAGADSIAGTPCLAVFGHTVTGAEGAAIVFTTSGEGGTGFLVHYMQFSGVQTPVSADAAIGASNPSSVTAIPAPALALATAGDLLFCVWSSNDFGQTISAPAGFTDTVQQQGSGVKYIDGQQIMPNKGTFGPFVTSQNVAHPYIVLSLALKAAVVASAPGQYLSAPIAVGAPLGPGVLTLNFSTAAIGFSGGVRWLPPATHFKWERDAPIAVIGGGQQFSLAGITPEQAAWASMTWTRMPKNY